MKKAAFLAVAVLLTGLKLSTAESNGPDKTTTCAWPTGQGQQGYSCSHPSNSMVSGSGGKLKTGTDCGNKVDLRPPMTIAGSCGGGKPDGNLPDE